jgi:hypothetical protein
MNRFGDGGRTVDIDGRGMLSSPTVNSDEARFCTAMGGEIASGHSGVSTDARARKGR